MKYKRYSEADKALMWDRWKKGDSMATIAHLFDREYSSVQTILQKAGGIRPAQRRRSDRLTSVLRPPTEPTTLTGHETPS